MLLTVLAQEAPTATGASTFENKKQERHLAMYLHPVLAVLIDLRCKRWASMPAASTPEPTSTRAAPLSTSQKVGEIAHY